MGSIGRSAGYWVLHRVVEVGGVIRMWDTYPRGPKSHSDKTPYRDSVGTQIIEPALVSSTRGVFEDEEEDAAVGMEFAAGGRFGREERVGWGDMRALNDETSA